MITTTFQSNRSSRLFTTWQIIIYFTLAFGLYKYGHGKQPLAQRQSGLCASATGNLQGFSDHTAIFRSKQALSINELSLPHTAIHCYMTVLRHQRKVFATYFQIHINCNTFVLQFPKISESRTHRKLVTRNGIVDRILTRLDI